MIHGATGALGHSGAGQLLEPDPAAIGVGRRRPVVAVQLAVAVPLLAAAREDARGAGVAVQTAFGVARLDDAAGVERRGQRRIAARPASCLRTGSGRSRGVRPMKMLAAPTTRRIMTVTLRRSAPKCQ